MGPTLPISIEIDTLKYRQPGESHREKCGRLAHTLKDSQEHYDSLFDILDNGRFMAAGRVQSSVGATRQTTPYNCFVAPVIEDSMEGIMEVATKAATTMRMGGGIGYDFSTIRPRGDNISSLQSSSSGPVSFMGIFDAVCATICSAGHRRGAQMGVLRVDHPDIEEFIKAKQNTDNLTNFNVSVGVTDAFMRAVEEDTPFPLTWGGKVYHTVNARNLWNEIMRSTWDWAEPGVLFIDTIQKDNPLFYCEQINATNPCAEQPLPANGACLLGSFNLVKYIDIDLAQPGYEFDFMKFADDIPHVIRAMDNVIDIADYPLKEQELEAKNKRRMGIGITGAANAGEALGYPYGSPRFTRWLSTVLELLANIAYKTSSDLAKEKGSFPMYQAASYNNGSFIAKLAPPTREAIDNNGLRNSHLLSIAPTGTISLVADNISSGIEPVFSYGYNRTIVTASGPKVERVDDYGVRVLGIRGKTADECSIEEHLSVLLTAQHWVDSSVSKTCNVGDSVSFEDFSNIYMEAWKGGAKGCTTYRASGKRHGILVAVVADEQEGAACYFDPVTGKKHCD